MRYVIVAVLLSTIAIMTLNMSPIHCILLVVLIWTPIHILGSIGNKIAGRRTETPLPPATEETQDTASIAADVPPQITIDTSRPIIERVAFWNRHPMDGCRLRIAYVDAYGDRTERTIRCTELQYGQDRFEITPDRIHAHCELRGEERTFRLHQIEHFWEAQGRTGRGREITDIVPFLIEHTAIPRGDDAHFTSPFTDDFLLDGSQVTLFYSQRNRPEDGQVILGLYCMTVITDNDGKRIYSVSGKNMKTGANRTIRGERITNACDPETGEVIDDLLAFAAAHRKTDPVPHSATS